MQGRIVVATALIVMISACKVQITAPPQGFVVNSSGGVCQPDTTCEINVVDTNFDDTFRAVGISDNWIFTGWINQPKGFCGGITGACPLSTRFFGGNEDLMALLESDETFYLEPEFISDLNGVLPAAAPLAINGGNLISGLSEADGSIDFFVVVAPGNGVLQVAVSQMEADLDVAVLRPNPDNFLNTFGNVLGSSTQPGTDNEALGLEVERGQSYFIAIANVEQQRSQYLLEVGFNSQDDATGRKKIKGDYRIQASANTVDCSNGERFVENEGSERQWSLNGGGKRTSVPNRARNEVGTMQLYLATSRYDAATGAYLERLTYRELADDGSLVQTRYDLTTGRFGGSGKFKGETWSYALLPASGNAGEEFIGCIGHATLKS